MLCSEFIVRWQQNALIHCFKENSACSSGAKKLKEALQQSLHDEYLEENPFAEATNSDVEDACEPFHPLDINEEVDDTEVV